jgi:hypothetical protein
MIKSKKTVPYDLQYELTSKYMVQFAFSLFWLATVIYAATYTTEPIVSLGLVMVSTGIGFYTGWASK